MIVTETKDWGQDEKRCVKASAYVHIESITIIESKYRINTKQSEIPDISDNSKTEG